MKITFCVLRFPSDYTIRHSFVVFFLLLLLCLAFAFLIKWIFQWEIVSSIPRYNSVAETVIKSSLWQMIPALSGAFRSSLVSSRMDSVHFMFASVTFASIKVFYFLYFFGDKAILDLRFMTCFHIHYSRCRDPLLYREIYFSTYNNIDDFGRCGAVRQATKWMRTNQIF